jgi:hypothetical protein
VAVDNTVWIEHWHNLEDECLTKQLGFLVVLL